MAKLEAPEHSRVDLAVYRLKVEDRDIRHDDEGTYVEITLPVRNLSLGKIGQLLEEQGIEDTDYYIGKLYEMIERRDIGDAVARKFKRVGF